MSDEQIKAGRQTKGADSLAWALLNASNEMAMLLDAHTGCVLALNQNMADSVGLPVASLLGTDLQQILPPELYARRRQMGEWLVAHRRPVRFEDEREGRHFLISMSPVCDEQGEVAQIAIFIRDLTEARRAEEAQRLAAIGRLSAGVAHEFNNLMGSMLLAARLVRDPDASPETRDLVDLVARCATNGKAICSNLTAFAQQKPGHYLPLQVEQTIEAALQLMAPRCASVRWQLVRDYDSLGYQVRGDATQLEHVFLNLLLNACQAMPSGGTLTLRTRYAADEEGDGAVVATVSDTGEGIAPEHLPHIFEPFFTTRGSIGAGESPGAGLGLSVCYGIVEQHGGTISVTSERGVGTMFTVRLPACGEVRVAERETAAAAPAPQARAAAAGATRARVLVAEDQQDLSRLLSRLMRAEGCEALLVRDAEQAAAALATERFDLVISDLIMPRGGGQRVVQAARALPNPPPVIVITGTMETAAAEEIVSAGAAHCLLKPFELSDLRRLMGDLLGEGQQGKADGAAPAGG